MTYEELMDRYEEIVVVDAEYSAGSGQRPIPVCCCAHELISGKQHRVWTYQKANKIQPPWPDGSDVLTVVWYGPAECGFYLSMGWKLPQTLLDLFSAYSWFTNGRAMRTGGKSLLAAMSAFGLNSMEAEEKEFWRNKIIGLDWDDEDIEGILDYCWRDVSCTEKLLRKMMPYIDFQRELLRGEFMKGLSMIEQTGIPLDTETLDRIKDAWPQMKEELIKKANDIYPFYENGVFKLKNFNQYLRKNQMQWQRTATGRPSISSDYLRMMGPRYPEIEVLREIRDTISQFKNLKLTIGPDHRNRFMQSPLRTITGRNAPSNAKNIFGTSKWMRNLIQAPPGLALSYCDYAGNEMGTAAYLSEDPLMMEAYESPDPYMWFAIRSGYAPEGSTKVSCPEVREVFKVLCLALMYGQGPRGISERLGISKFRAEELVKLHKKTFFEFWKWSDDTVSRALLRRKIIAPLGWQYHVRSQDWDEHGRKKGPNQRSLMNFPMQAAGSEMMRMATILIAKAGITCCAVVHDAWLISSDVDDIEKTVDRTRECMTEASKIVLKGYALKTDAETFRHPERFPEKRGIELWNMLQEMLPKPPEFKLT